jgi:hypothetical protein
MKYIVLAFSLFLLLPKVTFAAEIIDITFPVAGPATYSDDFNDQRSGHLHHATDIIAAKMTPIVAAMGGRVSFAPTDEPAYGYMLSIEGDDGYEYNYIHINNDTPGTDDGAGGAEHAYAPGIKRGARVERGEHIAWVGDSGNAESVGAHLHFEIYNGDTAIDPYESLRAAQTRVNYDREAELAAAISINDDKDLDEYTPPSQGGAGGGSATCESGSLIRTEEFSTVYYCGRDGGRYGFPNEGTFFSWYADFSSVKVISKEEMAAAPLKGQVTYKPGSFMVKMPSVDKVYAVGKGGTLRWIVSPDIAEQLYGKSWSKQVKDLSEAFFPAYSTGENVTRN